MGKVKDYVPVEHEIYPDIAGYSLAMTGEKSCELQVCMGSGGFLALAVELAGRPGQRQDCVTRLDYQGPKLTERAAVQVAAEVRHFVNHWAFAGTGPGEIEIEPVNLTARDLSRLMEEQPKPPA